MLIITTGASYIGEFLKVDCILTVLSIHDNPVGDVGISLIIKGIQQNKGTALTELRVQKCGLSEQGTIRLQAEGGKYMYIAN